MRVSAMPNQVTAYCRWLFGRVSRVCPPRGQPPGLGLASASIEERRDAIEMGAAAMACGSRANHWLRAGSSLGVKVLRAPAPARGR